MGASASASEVADLRHRRRDLRRELARVRWWRRLLGARRDITLAALTQPQAVADDGFEAAWHALAADAPTSRELTAAVWSDVSDPAPGDLDVLDALDERLANYESLLGDTLDSVTTQMVGAMGRAHGSHRDAREREHA